MPPRRARRRPARCTLAPDSPDALLLAARAALAVKDTTAARSGTLTRAVAAAPAAFDAHAMLAQLYASRGDLDRARTTLEQFAAAQPNAAAPRTALGMVLEAAGRPADARVRYEQALALDPEEPIASNNLARLYAADDATRLAGAGTGAQCRRAAAGRRRRARHAWVGWRSEPDGCRWRRRSSNARSR